MVIAARSGSRIAGLLFAANLVLHSGVDDEGGHFVAAYGIDAPDIASLSGFPTSNAAKTASRSFL